MVRDIGAACDDRGADRYGFHPLEFATMRVICSVVLLTGIYDARHCHCDEQQRSRRPDENVLSGRVDIT